MSKEAKESASLRGEKKDTKRKRESARKKEKRSYRNVLSENERAEREKCLVRGEYKYI